MERPLRYGWLRIPGLQDGDRTLEEQLLALRPALAEVAGRTVLDLGCAEGLIGLEFCRFGASRVLALDNKASHLEVARVLCNGYPIEFEEFNLNAADPEEPLSFDIVLALGIIHKLTFPERGLRFAARSARELLLLRSGRGSVNGIIMGKHSEYTCDSSEVLRAEGFGLEKTVIGTTSDGDEPVEYWRKRE